jgi:CRISPR-associated protein Csx14
MSRQIVLISSLGESPTVVTEAIDKIENDEQIQFTDVITLGTSEYEVRQGVRILYEHIPIYYSKRISYIHESIEAPDICTEQDNLDYLTLVAETLRFNRRFSDVYVSLAGGRKSMSALVALAVQIYGANLLCHVVHLMMDNALQRRMTAGNLIRYPKDWDELLHPKLEEVELVRLPVISLFPLINDFLNVLGGNEITDIDKMAKHLLEANKLIEMESGNWKPTKTGKQLYRILNDIEMLPQVSQTVAQNKTVDLKDHHGKKELRTLAEILRCFPYAQRIDSTGWNSQFDRGRTIPTSQGRLLIEVDPSQVDILIVTLADSSRGYALAIRTLAKSKSQAERVKRELIEFLAKLK